MTLVRNKYSYIPRLYPKSTVPIAEDAASVLDEFLQEGKMISAGVLQMCIDSSFSVQYAGRNCTSLGRNRDER